MALLTLWAGANPAGTTVVATGGTQCHGMDFVSTPQSHVTAFRFWKDVADTGTHIGAIYQTSGSVLQKSVTFAGESASGWQRMAFATPVPLVGGTTYRTSLSRTANIAYLSSHGAMTNGVLSGGGTGYYVSPATPPQFPGSFGGSSDYLTDIEVAAPSAAFFELGTIPGSQSVGGGTYSVGADITPTTTGVSLVGVYYYKHASDNIAGRVANCYRVSDQALLGSATFVETASGWQFVQFPSPIALTNGVAYRVAFLVGGSYYYYGSFPGAQLAGANMSSSSWYTSGGTLVFPTTQGANANQAIDVLLDGTTSAPTYARSSQVLAEVWKSGPGQASVTQALAEIFVQNQPPTMLWATQDLAEVFATFTPTTRLVVTQALVEVWGGPPTVQPLKVSSQLV